MEEILEGSVELFNNEDKSKWKVVFTRPDGTITEWTKDTEKEARDWMKKLGELAQSCGLKVIPK